MPREILPFRLKRSQLSGVRSQFEAFATVPQSRRSSLMDVLARVFSSTRFTITAQ